MQERAWRQIRAEAARLAERDREMAARERRVREEEEAWPGRAGRPRGRGPEMEECRWTRMLGEALPGVSLDCPWERGKKPRVRKLRELLQRDCTRERCRAGQEQVSSVHPHQHVGARHTKSAGWTHGRGARRAAGGEDSRCRQGKEMVKDRLGGRKERRKGEGAQRSKKWREHGQQWRKACMAAGDEVMADDNKNPPRRKQGPLRQPLRRWSTGAPTGADRAGGQQGAGSSVGATRNSAQSEKPDMMQKYWWTGVLWTGVLVE